MPSFDAIPSIPSLLWLFLAVFIVHDLEEIITVEPWMRTHFAAVEAAVPANMKKQLLAFRSITSSQFAIPVLLEVLYFIPVIWLAVEQGRYLLFLSCNSVMLAHVFTHLGQSLYLRRYTPGVVTAVLLVLPYSLYLFHRVLQAGIADWGQIGASLPLGLVLLAIVWFGHKLGRRLLPSS